MTWVCVLKHKIRESDRPARAELDRSHKFGSPCQHCAGMPASTWRIRWRHGQQAPPSNAALRRDQPSEHGARPPDRQGWNWLSSPHGPEGC
eukprot:3696370-Alexandrium_andersonii.AAC.1